MIDTHCHLYWPDFNDDIDAVIDAALAAGVTEMIVPATDIASMKQSAALAHRFPAVYFAAGVHPTDVGEAPADWADIMRRYLQHPKCVAVGEIGLDYYWDRCPRDVQQAALRTQLAIALEHDLPVIIHNRDSDDDLLAICREFQDGRLRGQFHCFSSTPEYAAEVLQLGFHISFTGNVTYKKSRLDEVLKLIPDDRLLIETDAPFMSPSPFRGTRNTPAHIPLIAERFALARQQTVEHIAECTTRNARALYHI